MSPIFYPSPRVSQLDAHILDSELTSLFKQKLAAVFQLQSNSLWAYNQQPELWDLVLNLVVFRLTTWRSGSSYGLALQNLKLTDLKKAKVIGYSKRSLLGAIIIGKFLFDKLQSYLYSVEDVEASSGDGRMSLIDRIRGYLYHNRTIILSKINNTFKLLNVVNFTLFLINGRYPSVVYRILGISLTPVVSDLLKFNGDSVNFEFQNRQLAWNVMTEFLVFILPLLQVGKLKRTIKKVFFSGNKHNASDGETPTVTPFTNLPISQCAICYKSSVDSSPNTQVPTTASNLITNPFITNCGHIYCYICLATKFNSLEASDDDSDGCLRCGLKLEWFKPLSEVGTEVNHDAIILKPDEEEDELSQSSDDEDEGHEKEGITRGDSQPRQSSTESALDASNINTAEESSSESEESEYSLEEEFEEDEAFEL